MPPSLELILTSGFQRVTTWWFSFFSLLCVVLGVLAPLLSKFTIQIILCLPVLHCLLFWGVIILCSLPYYILPPPSDQYIRNHHPNLWKKLHPWGRFSHNDFAAWGFIFNRYDDGQDVNLQIIKQRYRRLALLQLWSFALFVVPFLFFLLGAIVIDSITLQVSGLSVQHGSGYIQRTAASLLTEYSASAFSQRTSI